MWASAFEMHGLLSRLKTNSHLNFIEIESFNCSIYDGFMQWKSSISFVRDSL